MRAAPAARRAPAASLITSEQLEAMLAVSAAVAEADALGHTLGTIASTAAQLAHAEAAAIILRESESTSGLTVVASHGLSAKYAEYLNETRPLEVGKGPSGLAAARAEPVCVEDVLNDPLFAPWRDLALQEHYGSMVSVPLRPRQDQVIGVLNAYRGEAGPWTPRDLNLLSFLADHAAIAIRTARLLDSTRRQVDGLSLMVRSLRAQTHEHSNRLHAIYGLLVLGEVEQARRLIATVESAYHSLYGRVTARIENATIAGFLVAESAIARESGVELTVDGRSRLVELPPRLDEVDAVTVLGNLVHNAVEAVSGSPKSRRRVAVKIHQTASETVFRVRDWGPGVPGEYLERMFDDDFTTKPGHAGIGLAVVRSVVARARGRLQVDSPAGGGLAVSAVFPA